jgi:hypothetical protein
MNPIMWRSDHEKLMKRTTRWLYACFIMMIICGGLIYLGWSRSGLISDQAFSMRKEIDAYHSYKQILLILRPKGITLSQGLDIADSLTMHSRKNGVPLSLGLAIMAQESGFNVDALSRKKAMGLMQLMPDTFDAYNKNLKLGFGKAAILDPVTNIMIACLHLKDLIAEAKAKKEDDRWKEVLRAYSGNARGYPETVMKLQKEFERKFRDG